MWRSRFQFKRLKECLCRKWLESAQRRFTLSLCCFHFSCSACTSSAQLGTSPIWRRTLARWHSCLNIRSMWWVKSSLYFWSFSLSLIFLNSVLSTEDSAEQWCGGTLSKIRTLCLWGRFCNWETQENEVLWYSSALYSRQCRIARARFVQAIDGRSELFLKKCIYIFKNIVVSVKQVTDSWSAVKMHGMWPLSPPGSWSVGKEQKTVIHFFTGMLRFLNNIKLFVFVWLFEEDPNDLQLAA